VSRVGEDISLQQAPRHKLAETVAQQLLAAVRDKPPGTRLPSERELTDQLGVGRSTVREALKGLAMIGVVEIRHGQGVFVAGYESRVPAALDVATAEAGELREARALVEPTIARLAALRRTPDDVAELEAVLEAHRHELEDGTPPVLQASRFHVVLAAAAGNQVLAAVLRPFFRLMIEQGPQLYATDPGYAAWELAEHEAILDAVRDGEAELAFERMRQHVGAMEEHYSGDVSAGRRS
jgi:GntR family transcriptional regulator, transcriptional repressor for pyruvate dehydrogenase complex